MPRRLDSVNLGGYVEEIAVDDGELDKVVAMLGIADAGRSEAARHRIYGRLEDLKTARSRTVKAQPIRNDFRDLNDLRRVMDPTEIKEHSLDALDALESLRSANPVLYQRLQWQLRPRPIHDRVMAVERGAEPIERMAQEISTATAALKEEIGGEDGRGAPSDYPALAFASSLFQIWKEYTGRGTARQNALYRERFPFGGFVDAAGKLIEPDFNGHHVARRIHEASRDEPQDRS